VRSSNHWAWSHGLGLLVCFLGHKRNIELEPREEPLALDQKLDGIIQGMHSIGDRVGTIERKSSWDGQQNNVVRNPDFSKNQNPSVGRASPDHDISPPFQDNYVVASTSSEPIEDTHINLMGLKNDQHAFLTEEDQDYHDVNQFQTKSGESFDFKQGYDSTVYEVHKQYKLRTRTIDVTKNVKPNDTIQPKKMTEKVALTESTDKEVLDPKEVTIEDVTDMQPSNNQPFLSFPSKENSNSTPKSLPKIEIPQDIITDTPIEKGKFAFHNAKTQSKKPFDLEAEIGKLKISIPLAELAKHDVYRQQIKRSLQMPENRDDVNVLDDQPKLLFGPEVDGKSTVGVVLPFYVSPHIHDKVLHNVMFDSGASHNPMLKDIMEKLNLDVTRPYKDLFSFDSS